MNPPQIYGSVRKYQAQLIERIAKDLKNLKDRYFETRFSKSRNSQVAMLRDLPPVSSMLSRGDWWLA